MKAMKIVGAVLSAVLVLVVGCFIYVASVLDVNRIKIELASAVLQQKQRTLKIDGELKLEFWPNAAIRLNKLSLSERVSAQEFASVEQARVSVAMLPLLKRRIEVDTVELSGVKALLIRRKDGSLNIADLTSSDKAEPSAKSGSAAKSDTQPLLIDVAGVKIANVQLIYRDEQKGSTIAISGLDLSSGHIRADVAQQSFSAESVALSLKGKQDASSFDLKLTLGALSSDAQALKLDKLLLALEARSGDANVKAQLETGAALDAARQMLALDKISGSIELTHPQKQLKLPLHGALSVDLAHSSLAGHLTTKLNESNMALKFSLLKLAPLAFGFDLDIDQLNLDQYLPPAQQAQAPMSPGGAAKVDLNALKGLNGQGTLKLGSLQVANVKANNIRATFKVANGQLDVAPLSATLYEGALTCALSAHAQTHAVTLKQNIDGLAIGPLLRGLLKKDLLDGRGTVTLDLSTRGETVLDMKKALAGRASLALRDGAIKGINLAQTLRDLKTRFAAKQDSVPSSQAGDKTDFSELSASFKLAGGVAHNDELSVKSPFLRLGGSGDIDIGASQFNYVLKAGVVANAAGQGGEGLANLKGVTVPVRLTGPFEKPDWKIEFSGIASEAVKVKLDETKQALQQKATEQLKDKLKGLLGR